MTGTKKAANKYSREDYRQISALNQSMLKKFDEDPLKFYKVYILGQPDDDDDTYAIIMGKLIDFYFLDCDGREETFEQDLESKFAVSPTVRSSAQAFELADELFSITIRDREEDGAINSNFEDRFKEAFSIVQAAGKYKNKTWEKGLEDFNKVAKGYFDCKVSNFGKTVVDLGHIEKTKKMAQQLKENEFLGHYASSEDVYNKVAVEFVYRDQECKAEIDRLRINHDDKLIIRTDFKTNYDIESFEFAYLKRKYYLQNSFYELAVKKWAIDAGLDDYTIMPMEFLVLDTSPLSRWPLLYTTTAKHVSNGFKGFYDAKGYYHRGVDELITDILWAKDSGIWTITRENYMNRGRVALKEEL